MVVIMSLGGLEDLSLAVVITVHRNDEVKTGYFPIFVQTLTNP
jgi:hypothetical protein